MLVWEIIMEQSSQETRKTKLAKIKVGICEKDCTKDKYMKNVLYFEKPNKT